MAPGRRLIAGYKLPTVYPTDRQITAVAKNVFGEIAPQQSKVILQETTYRRGGT
jgi:hypothetical protein